MKEEGDGQRAEFHPPSIMHVCENQLQGAAERLSDESFSSGNLILIVKNASAAQTVIKKKQSSIFDFKKWSLCDED